MFLHRLIYGGIVGAAISELEQDVCAFVTARKSDLGGKILEQYLEQLRVAVSFREREGSTLQPVGLTH
jgi:puromycin-sensitive aminopeptidase